jgi:hypothetical protein
MTHEKIEKTVEHCGHGHHSFGDRPIVELVEMSNLTLLRNIPVEMEVVGWFVILQEAPDLGNKTWTVKLTDGTNDITGVVTFTQGAEAGGAIKSSIIDTAFSTLAKDSNLIIEQGGTTAVLGAGDVYVFINPELT